MNRGVRAPAAALVTALIGSNLLAGAAPSRKTVVPPAKSPPHASAEPTEAQLPPVNPAWQQNGWHSVVPHAYVLRPLAPARIRPEANAPAAFWLKGGVRVPILEQHPQWWRVGWIHGQTGWMPAAYLQPHASFILIDVQTGRVLCRLAAKGERGPVAAGGLFWSLSDTGITRTSLAQPPAIWSNPVRSDPQGSLPEESVWTPNRAAFFVQPAPGDMGRLIEVSTHNGAVRRAGPADRSLALERADANGRLVLTGDKQVHLFDARNGHEVRRAQVDEVWAIAKNGSVYASAKYAGGRRDLVRYDSDLNPLARIKLAGDLSLAQLSPHERILALSSVDGKPIELRRADTLARVTTLRPGRGEPARYVNAVAGGANGWWVISSDEDGDGSSVTHYTQQGQWVRTWRSDSSSTVMSPDGRFIFMPHDSDLLVIDTTRATTRRLSYSWRRPLPSRYLPPPSEPDTPTHLEISNLTLTPDGRTLVLTEWLNGDPAG